MTRQAAKLQNFGAPAVPPAEVVWLLIVLMNEAMWRRRYADERSNPEWFDLGGEA